MVHSCSCIQKIDVDKLLLRLVAPVYGFDLHWMAHGHGSIEFAKKVKEIHPETLVIFGGISATYYTDELIQYPAVDVVVKGYDTLEPLWYKRLNYETNWMSRRDIQDITYEAIAKLVTIKN